MVVPSLPSPPGPIEPLLPSAKDALRAATLDARKAFVRSLSDGDKAQLEQKLAERLTALCASASVVGGYAPMGSEISPLLAMEEARAVGRIVAFPAFHNPAKPFRFRAGDPLAPGPFGIMQPKPERAGGRARPDPGAADRHRRQRHPARPRQGPLRPGAARAAQDRRAS